MRISFLSCLLFVLFPGLGVAADAEIKVRDTSFFVGTPFNFYIRVNGVRQAAQPELLPSKLLQVRYVGSAPSTRSGEAAVTFTYEAVPFKGGEIPIPGGFVRVGNDDLPIPQVEIQVSTPEATTDMDVEVALSHTECYVGEPVTLTFSWTTNLSLNGMRAVDVQIPALTDYHFKVREPLNPVDLKAANAIGIPVASQRVISAYEETTRNGQPAVRVSFQKVLIPTRAGDFPTLIQPASLLCSYVQPRDERFKGTRYPSYFDNEFFDKDLTGEFRRLMAKSPPLTLRVKHLPTEGKPAGFDGIIGAFELHARAETVEVEVAQPISLELEARGLAHPHLLTLPALSKHLALSRNFDFSGTPPKSRVEGSSAIFTEMIRPQHEEVTAIPRIELSFFDPLTASYGVARSEPISIVVTKARAAVSVFEAEFSDGTQLKNEIEPVWGGIFHNYTGPSVLESRGPPKWNPYSFNSLLLWLGPPLVFTGLWLMTRNQRLARRDPKLAIRRGALRRFRSQVWELGCGASPVELSSALRTYIERRFEVPAYASGPDELRDLAKNAALNDQDVEVLAHFVDASDAGEYSKHEIEKPKLKRSNLVRLVKKLDRLAVGIAVFAAFGLTLASLEAKTPAETLFEAEQLFNRANELAHVDPSQANDHYQRAVEAYRRLQDDHGIENGELYYNLGNAHFLSGDIGRAILNYRRAERFLPGDLRLLESLRFVRTKRVDLFLEGHQLVVEPTGSWAKVTEWARRFWGMLNERTSRFVILGVLVAVVWAIFGISLVWRVPGKWISVSVVGVLVLFLLSLEVAHRFRHPERDAVITEVEVFARKGDGLIYDAAYSNPLHSGTEVRILETRRDWIRIRTPDKNEGWIPITAAERVLSL